jgi:hypothetical protein
LKTNKQLLQYIGGAMDIGKTHIIKVVQNYSLSTRNKQKLKIAAYTSNATLLINITPIHVLLGLLFDKHANVINQPQ